MAQPIDLRRAGLLAGLALAHLGLCWWADRHLHGPARTEQPARSATLRLLALPVPQPAASPPRPAQPASTRVSAAVRPPAEPASLSSLPAPAAPEELPAAPPVIPAPAMPAPGLLLDSEATRRAVREAGRSPLLAERAASAMDDGAPLRPEEKLGQQIKNAATTDCLKGEFAGAGAGLLSLPFWALAELRGKCRR